MKFGEQFREDLARNAGAVRQLSSDFAIHAIFVRSVGGVARDCTFELSRARGMYPWLTRQNNPCRQDVLP